MSPVHSALYEVQTMLYLAAALSSSSPFPAAQAPVSGISSTVALPTSHMCPYSANTTPESSLPGTPPYEGSKESSSKEAEALDLFIRAWALYDSLSPSGSPQSTPNIPSATLPGLRCTSPSNDSPISPLSPYSPSLGRSSPHGCHHRKGLGPKTELWARAAYASLLRRLGRDEDAENTIDYIR